VITFLATEILLSRPSLPLLTLYTHVAARIQNESSSSLNYFNSYCRTLKKTPQPPPGRCSAPIYPKVLKERYISVRQSVKRTQLAALEGNTRDDELLRRKASFF
jgi:hypothetical protein